MSNALAVINNFDELEKTGGMMARSGLFKDSADAFKAMVKIQAGQELGVPPFQAMAGINIIHGKPVLSAGLLASLIKNHADYDYRVGSHTELECVIVFMEKGDEAGVSSFSIDDAKRAGVFNTNPNWKKYPKNMLFARALSNGAKWYCAGIFGGSVYVEGEIVDSEPVRVTQPRPTPAPKQKTSKGRKVTIEGEFEDIKQENPVAKKQTSKSEPAKQTTTDYKALARAGNWAGAIAGIPRYAGDFGKFMGATQKIVAKGINNPALTGRGEDAPELRARLFSVMEYYAKCKDGKHDEFNILNSIHAALEGHGLVELLKPIATDDFDDITSASDATQPALIGGVEAGQNNALVNS